MLPILALTTLLALPAQPAAEPDPNPPTTLRIATFNLEDVRTDDLKRPFPPHPRLKSLAAVVQHIRPSVILLNEIAYDGPGAPGFREGDKPGQNGQRFADSFLAVSQGAGLEALHYKAFMAPSNTGMPSGFDLDHNGKVVTTYPAPPPAAADGSPGEQTADGREYGGDCWGFGTFPGQYAMALLVDERLTIQVDQVRTFRLLPWDYMSGAVLPSQPDNTPWFTAEQKGVFRLSSKSHWDVPVQLPSGAIVHFLCSHPTPPVFDGPEKRNARRNHDEIRFWADYIEDDPYIVDDNNKPGGLAGGAGGGSLFVILGDLNADPKKGESFKDPMGTLLLSNKNINAKVEPSSDVAVEKLEPTDTAHFGLRADYILPSANLSVRSAGIWREAPAGAGRFPSDHFPVWMEVDVPSPPTVTVPPRP